MGHREDLLAGARRCLYERGYAHTTARDIVAASGTNLASIGYHFGSKEALLNEAMIQAIQEWGDQLERTLAFDIDATVTPMERFAAIWTAIIDSFGTHRQLWIATFEAFVQAERSPEVHAFLTDALQEGRLGLAALFEGIDATVDQDLARKVGSFYQALLTGILVQWMIDPQRAPSGQDMAKALEFIRTNTR